MADAGDKWLGIEPGLFYLVFFAAIGAAFIGAGVLLSRGDPELLLLVPMGAVFIAAGFMARWWTRTPKGMKRVTADENRLSGPGPLKHFEFVQTDSTLVPKDAAEAAVEKARLDLLTKRWSARPDWATGIIDSEQSRNATGLWIMLLVSFVVWAVLSTLAWWFRDPLLLFGTAIFTIGFALLLYIAGRDFWTRYRDGDSHLHLEVSPVHPGGVLKGRVRTGLSGRRLPRDPFEMDLRCVETTVQGSGKSRPAPRVLWEATHRRPAQISDGSIVVDVEFDLPADQPPTTLSVAHPRVRWELYLRLPRKGLNFRNLFYLPVVDQDQRLPAPGGDRT